MKKTRWFVTAAVLIAAIYALGQGSQSTSTSQSKNGGASSSASASSSSRSGGGFQGGSNQMLNNLMGGGGNLARPTHVVTYRFEARQGNAMVSRPISSALGDQQQQYWSQLAGAGKLVMAGYYRERDGALALLSVREDREALQLAQADPAVKQGATFEIRAWSPSVMSSGSGAPGSGTNTSNESSQTSHSGETKRALSGG